MCLGRSIFCVTSTVGCPHSNGLRVLCPGPFAVVRCGTVVPLVRDLGLRYFTVPAGGAVTEHRPVLLHVFCCVL